MIILESTKTLAGGASSASKLTYHVFGMELSGTTKTYKELCTGQLASTAATIYTAGTGITAFISSIIVVNTDTSVAYTFQFFTNGTAAVNALTEVMTLGAGLRTQYEDGSNNWTFSTIVAGTTLVNDIHPSYSEYVAIANPSLPATDTIRMYARKMSGRLLPKWLPNSGLDNPIQPAFFGNNIIFFTPLSSTTVTGGFGTTWAKGGSSGTVSTLTPASTAPAIINQMKRTRHANAVTTANQAMGIISTAAGMPQFWRGNSAGLGGFFFFVRFNIGLWASNTDRLFVGLTPGTAEVVTSDTVPANSMGLWHDSTDGGNLYFMTKDATTMHKGNAIAGITLGASQGFDFYIFAKPNDNTVYYRVDDINAGVILIDTSESNNLPAAATFLGPQVEISNGTSDIVANTVAIDINRIYIESDH